MEDEDEGSPATSTDECSSTAKLLEARRRQSPNHDHAQARPEITFAYYPFLCINNLSSLNTDDVNYLESQGCFRVPENSCLDDLLRAFFRYAHPILPVVNEAEFWSVYDPLTSTYGDKPNRVPVILLSAMLFVACKVKPMDRSQLGYSLISPCSTWTIPLLKTCSLVQHMRCEGGSFGRPR